MNGNPVPAAVPSRRTLATALALARWLEKHRIGKVIGAQIAALKADEGDGLPRLAPGTSEVAHIAGRTFATVVQPTPAVQVTVTDQRAYTDWLEKEFPSEVTRTVHVEVTAEETDRVLAALADVLGPGRAHVVAEARPAFLKVLTDAAKTGGGSTAIHPRTGEEMTIPGVEVTTTKPSPTVNFTKDADRVIEQAHREGLLGGAHLAAMLALPAAEGGEQQ
ncbi:hypothetical protein [Planomonospora algeriensis]